MYLRVFQVISEPLGYMLHKVLTIGFVEDAFLLHRPANEISSHDIGYLMLAVITGRELSDIGIIGVIVCKLREPYR